MDENVTELESGSDGEEYEVEGIWDSAVYAKKSAMGYLSGLYYLISWKGYPKKENTWDLALAVQHLQKLIRIFHKDNPNKPIATSLLANTAPPMARPLVALFAKIANQKRGWQVINTRNKKAKT